MTRFGPPVKLAIETHRARARFVLAGVLLVLVNGFVACDNATTTPPTAPTPQAVLAPPPAASLTAVALFGRAIERTDAGDRPIAGVLLYCDACGQIGHTFLTTDSDGHYRFSGDLEHGGGIWISAGGPVQILVDKAGYTVPGGDAIPPNASYPEGYFVTVPRFNSDTEFNIVMTKQLK